MHNFGEGRQPKIWWTGTIYLPLNYYELEWSSE